ncbi:hypothetical protein [Rickettsiella endosymbiont of Miltochrista miniata]|uniref:hypothetical protein n=1 Tax=Rickettsiella endosymbiont of Miltochrista miniata TaxID=3066239 RepID=UPI00313C8E77
MKSEGVSENQRHSSFLHEISSEIDERLTLKMKQVFAKRFKNYFDNYARSYLTDQDTTHPIHSPTLMRPGMKETY